MKIQNLKFKIQHCAKVVFMFYLVITAYCLPPTVVSASEKWQGVDESVVEKYAKEHGREAREPLINTDQGDLLLFVFLIAGTAGGFIAGYYWRALIVEKASSTTREGIGK